jgi:hypothetical protein
MDYGWDDVLRSIQQGLSDPRWSDVLKKLEALIERLRQSKELPVPWLSHFSLVYPVIDSLGWVVVEVSDDDMYKITIDRIGSLGIVQRRGANLESIASEILLALSEAPNILR